MFDRRMLSIAITILVTTSVVHAVEKGSPLLDEIQRYKSSGQRVA
jgi:hypothetical protein